MITYNHRPYIAQAIDGVLGQETDYPFELVIGEDCSSDGTRAIVFEYQRQRPDVVRVVSSEQNVGATENEARTRDACRGKYIAFCEGDDFWHRRDKLQLQVAYLEAHPECGLVCSAYDVHYVVSGKTIRDFNACRHRRPPENPTLADFVQGVEGLDGGAIATCTVVLRRDLLQRIETADPHLYREKAFLMGDTQKWAEIAHHSRLHYLEECLATQNALPESASRSRDWRKTVRFFVSVAEMFLYLCEKYALPQEMRVRHEQKWGRFAFELAFLDRDLALARQALQRGYRLSWTEYVKYHSMRNALLYSAVRHALSFRRRLMSRGGQRDE
jgi:glycosyltransferase involved in cell wall biosynthesis